MELEGSGVVGTRYLGDEVGDLLGGGVKDLVERRRKKG